jgi:hypothetical protein
VDRSAVEYLKWKKFAVCRRITMQNAPCLKRTTARRHASSVRSRDIRFNR